MKYPIAELADKFAILILKSAHGFEVLKEMEVICPEIKHVQIIDLYKINSKMWSLEEEITSKQSDLETVGRLYLELRELSLQRVDAKNKIARAHGEPEEDRKY